jgi:outer membrane protein OmpA-like peptidoglycan-associated protein
MKTWKLAAGLALPAFALGACAVMPEHDSELTDARAAVVAAQNDPKVVELAPTELNQAVEAMHRADRAWSDHRDVDYVHHLAYLAWTRAAIAQETARMKEAEASVASATAERDRVRLEARTREAQRAQARAASAEISAQRAQAQAEVNRRQAIVAQQQAAGATQAAQAARSEAEQAQQQAALARAQAANANEHAQALQAALAELQARPTDRGMVVTMGDLLFDTGSAHLKPGGERIVDNLADFMRTYPQRRVAIEGFTDSVGNPGYNQDLSERRADAVRLALIDRGIDPARIVARGYGEEYPVASNGNVAGRQMNRRVEVVISDVNGVIGSRGSAPLANVGRGPRG